MKTIYHAADSRGNADHGWLKSRHTFSFAEYHDPDRMGFGALRVINDDQVSGGEGFGKHPHRDMEIISIPLSGKLNHGDSMGNDGTIESGEIQVMSAGTGVIHSEMNGNSDEAVKFLQIWVMPNKLNVEPRYQQIELDPILQDNTLNQVLSPNPDDQGVWIHQDAWFHIGQYSQETQETYTLKNPKNGVYIFVIEGDITLGDTTLSRRDGLGIYDTQEISFTASAGSHVLFMEVPM